MVIGSKSPKLGGGWEKAIKPSSRSPLWDGPGSDTRNGGVTQGLISRFLCCPERCRIRLIEGLGEPDEFSHRMEYGNMGHVCEEALAAGKDWVRPLTDYCISLVKKYGAEKSAEINKWFNVCKVQFPVYVSYWKKQDDVKKRKPFYQEQVFNVPYKLPSGRIVRLRGKFDSVDQIGKGLYLQENKYKGEYFPERLLAELPLDLQTMTYLTALSVWESTSVIPRPVLGCRYNVIRRPLSSGKFCISQKKGMGKAKKGAETEEQFYERLGGLIAEEAKAATKENRECWFFSRFRMEISPSDLAHFQKVCLNPVLENLLDDYEWWTHCYEFVGKDVYDYQTRKEVFPDHRLRHYLLPSGIWNPTIEGRVSPYDSYIQTGSLSGLVKVESLFRELE